MRTFAAIEAPAEIKQRIEEISERLRSTGANVRWEPREKFHATIKFLGETDQSQVEGIIRTLEGIAATSKPFTVRYTSLGCFPNRREPRIVWVGVEDPREDLFALQQRIESALTALGFAPEDRQFHPHITLGRVKTRRNIANLLRMLESVTFDSEPVVVREVELIRSDLRPAGSIYTTLKSIPLTA